MDITEISEGLYVASNFYPIDEDLPPRAVVFDLDKSLKDEPLTENGTHELERFTSATQLLRAQGYNVVLRCTAGRNRSCAVAALCLVQDGIGAHMAIDLVRNARAPSLRRSGGKALTNESFVRFIEGRAGTDSEL